MQRTPKESKKDEADFKYWEERYGRKLTDLEKNEIKTNLSAFFDLLWDEGLKQGLGRVLKVGATL